ncbi:unnamed protein product, partial [Ceratitis capitata]
MKELQNHSSATDRQTQTVETAYILPCGYVNKLEIDFTCHGGQRQPPIWQQQDSRVCCGEDNENIRQLPKQQTPMIKQSETCALKHILQHSKLPAVCGNKQMICVMLQQHQQQQQQQALPANLTLCYVAMMHCWSLLPLIN